MGRSSLLLGVGIAAGLGLGQLGFGQLEAQQKPVVQTIFRADLDNLPGQEAILEVLTVPPGLATPRHLHPNGHEIAYVLEGVTRAEIDGRDTKTYKAGEVVHVPPDIPHVGANASSTVPLKVLIVRIREKSKPLTVLVN
jgi:quercetin dioxygenase-like cupin family protein